MAITLKNSKIKFLRYQILELNLDQKEFDPSNNSVNLSVSVDEYRVEYEQDEALYYAKGYLKILMSGKDNEGNHQINGYARILGVFIGEKKHYKYDVFKEFSHNLIMPRLIGVMRSLFLNVSAQSGTGALMIPLVDISFLNSGEKISYQNFIGNLENETMADKFRLDQQATEIFGVILTTLVQVIQIYTEKEEIDINDLRFLEKYKTFIFESEESEKFFREMIDYFLKKTGCI